MMKRRLQVEGWSPRPRQTSFRIAPSGQVTKLLDTSVVETNLADFAYLPDRHLIIAPTWTDNRVVAYELVE